MREQLIKSLNTGDILLVNSKGFLPRAIQLFQGNEYNHAAMYVSIWDEPFVAEADKKGVQFTHLDHYTSNPDRYKLMFLKPNFYIDERQFALQATSLAGSVNYDFINLFIHQSIKMVTGKWIGRKGKKASNRFICGEFVAYVYCECTETVFQEWWNIAPKDLYNSENFSHFTYDNINNNLTLEAKK